MKTSRRPPWERLPSRVRRAIEASLGSAVVEARTQEGGYSRGAAARLRLANGGAVFVKAGQIGVENYRHEANTAAHLPAELPVPRLLDIYDDGEWVALTYELVEGRPPTRPCPGAELDRVAGAIGDLAAALEVSPLPHAPRFADANGPFMAGWRELATATLSDLGPWLRVPLDRLSSQEVELSDLCSGDTLLHNDIRSDNLLLTPDGRVVFLDWGLACNGASWLDLVMFALTANWEGGADVDVLIRGHPLTRDIDSAIMDTVLLAGFAAYSSLHRRHGTAYHRTAADATLRWLRCRAVGS